MPFGIGRSLKRAGRAIAKPFEQAADEIGRLGERIGREAERAGGKILSEKYKRELRRARNIAVNATETLGPSTALVGGPAGTGASTYLGYEEEVASDEQRAYQRQAEREAAQRAKAEAERGQEMLRRRRLRRLGSVYASGFGSASTDFKTVLGI